MTTETIPKPEKPNPFRRQYHNRMGGQYKPTQVDDANQKQLLAEEAAVSFERARWQAINEARTTWHPTF